MIIERQAANAFVYIEKDEKQMNDFVRLVTSIIAYRKAVLMKKKTIDF